MEIHSKLPNYYGKFYGQGMVTLSFDDGREDNYRVALPIMQKYGLLGTFHITTGYIDGTLDGTAWGSADGPMTLTQLEEMHRLGHEISSHGDQHLNTESDITTSVTKLKAWGLTRNGQVEGFASPGSGLTLENIDIMTPWFVENGITHARSASAGGEATSKDVLNNMNYPPLHNFRLTSQVITYSTDISDIVPLIADAVNSKRWCILMLHSILKPDDAGVGFDNWWWSEENFEHLCGFLAAHKPADLLTVTMRDGLIYSNGLHQQANLLDRRGHFRKSEPLPLLRNRYCGTNWR